VATELIHSLGQRASGLAKLNHAGLQVIERSFNKAILFLIMSQEIVPKGMLHQTVNNFFCLE
jgi:hypothetical protein